MKVERLTIYPKDIGIVTGKTARYGRLLMEKIRKHYKKEEHQFVTIEEFCAYTGLKIEAVRQCLKNST